MIESFGTKLFKSLTATADEIGSKFQIAFSNFSDAITGSSFLTRLSYPFLLLKISTNILQVLIQQNVGPV